MIFKPNFERGQALVIITFAIIGLVGITGLAIDGGMAFSDRRHAQNAADTAALAGALAKINAQKTMTEYAARTPMRIAALNRAEDNGYTHNLLTSTVEVYTCDEIDIGATCAAPYAGDSNYIQVIITSHVNTFFAKVIGIPQVHNRVQAIALADDDDSGPLGNGEAIVSYATDCQSPDNFIVEGDTIVNIEGAGLFVNTDDPACGFKCESNGATINSDITSVGGNIDLKNSCLDNYDYDTYTTSEDSTDKLDFPITLEDIGLDVPSECNGPQGTYTNYPAGTWPGIIDYPQYATEPITVIHPGYFGQFPPPKDQPSNDLNDVMFLDENGVYCVGEVLRWNQPRFVLIGHNVTLFIRAGNGFSLTGGIIDIDAPDSGPYAGYLVIVEPNYGDPELSASPEACTINGSADNGFTGTIWAPYCDCTLNGGGESFGFNAQLLCYTIDVGGGGIVTFTYDSGVNGQRIDPPETGIAQ
jgi:Flp pilus assembly protein TadG